MFDLGFINGKVYIDGHFVKTNVYIKDQKITHISHAFCVAHEIIDLKGKELLPGLIDPHVHFELDLGWIKSVDDFYHGSIAAAYGGVTSIVDFLDPVDNIEDLEKAFFKRLEQAKHSHIDYHFHATLKNPKCDLEAFVIKMKQLGMHTLKLFTTYSDSGRMTDDDSIYELLKLSHKHRFLILAHIENDSMIDLSEKMTYDQLNLSRPTSSETFEALKLCKYVRQTKGYLYMVHLSSGKTIESIKKHYSDILNKHFFIETCPQYIYFDESHLKSKNGYLYTCAPPLRPIEEKELLMKNFDDIYTIGTDHCAFNQLDKTKVYLKDMPLGLGGIEHSFLLMRQKFSHKVIKMMTQNVASTQKLKHKGAIKLGYDADLVVYEPKENQKASMHHGRSDYDLYQGYDVPGVIVSTLVRGRFIIKEGLFIGGKGQWITGGISHD